MATITIDPKKELQSEIRNLIRPFRKPGGLYRKHLTSDEVQKLLVKLTELSRE